MPNLCVVHHKDFNPANNAKSNLLAVCWGCHRRLHAILPDWRYLTDPQIAVIVRDGLRIMGKDNIDPQITRLKERIKSKNQKIKKLKNELDDTWRRVYVEKERRLGTTPKVID
jgi:flagellar biosynthesis chaperone FliJ